ncbi:cysteinyl-tRNA synthetase [Rodentibacter pneumotropicus]|uniref:Cysteinyl-tRNA synthetase n=1 Tax=Rodentibacter pneumotropicus TaxID=758 RepID=A0A448MRW4_9PAST|nr:cysteinyl-tRNA synthetase [Rodentibacter pneumotropicus]
MFDVESFKEYGQLSRQDLEQLQAGARVDISKAKKTQWTLYYGKCQN